jgi:hypothetical protein
MKAVSRTYSDLGVWAPKHYWCIFHIIKSFKARSIQDLSSRAEEAINEFQSIIYGDDPEKRLSEFYNKWILINPKFIAYVKKQWGKNLSQCAISFRTVCDPLSPKLY